MTHVVCEPCFDCKYTDCVTVCPVDCFSQDEHLLYIDPDTCIDCGLCIAECPVRAIFADHDVPSLWQSYIALNAERARALKAAGRSITEQQPAKEGGGCQRSGN
jgi:ferredoxin